MNAAVGACPALLTMSLEMAHPLGMFGGLAITWSPLGVRENPMPLPVASGMAVRTGDIRCGRTQVASASRAATKTTSVLAMAGSVRRMSTPAVTPSAKAKAA